MKSEYFQIILLMILYNIFCFLSLVFATGYGVGLKLDDNQLIAYILIFISFFISFSSLKVKDTKKRLLVVRVMGLLVILYLLLFFSGIVGSNEAMFIFVIPIFGIPVFIFVFIFHYLTFNK